MGSFTPFGAELAGLAGRLASLDERVASFDERVWMHAACAQLRGFVDAKDAAVTVEDEREIRRGVDPGAGPASGSGIGDPSSTGNGHPAGNGEAPGGSGSSGNGEDLSGNGETSGNGGSGGSGLAPLPSPPPESPREMRRRLRRAKWLQRCGRFAAALQAGRITAAHVDVLGAAFERCEQRIVADVLADEAALLLMAQSLSVPAFATHFSRVIARVQADGGVAKFERQVKDSFCSNGFDDETEMYKLFVQLDPIRGTALFKAVQARVDALYRTDGATDGLTAGQVRAQALYDLVCKRRRTSNTAPTGSPGHRHGTPGAGVAGRDHHDVDDAATDAADDHDVDIDVDIDDDVDGDGVSVEVLVITDLQTLVGGEHEHTVCETYEGARVPASLVRSLCGTAAISAAIADADGKVLAVGYCQRLANRRQRRALRAMYRTCAHPDCNVTFDRCHIHHITPWEQRGPTDLINLVPLCFEHHHLVHDSGWQLSIDTARTLTWQQPDGTVRVSPLEPLLTPLNKRRAAASDTAPVTTEPDGPPPGPAPPPPEPEQARLFHPPAA